MTDNLIETPVADTPVPEVPAEDSPSPDRPEGVPEKFWDSQKKELRTEALLQSYLALEKRFSKMVPLPENEADRFRLYKLLGCPDTADQYQITLSSDVVDIDPSLNARLHAKGFTNDQVQEIYDLAVEKLVPLVLDMATEFQADREIERLCSHFGGASSWAIIARQLQDYGRKHLPEAAYQGLCCSYDGVMALYAMMQNDIRSPLSRDGERGGGVMDEGALRKMMQDPKYWRERDPAFIAKVGEGFQRLYGA